MQGSFDSAETSLREVPAALRMTNLDRVAESVGRPSGTCVVIPLYPALKRGANLGRPSGALYCGVLVYLPEWFAPG
jgi:hypothetical protein